MGISTAGNDLGAHLGSVHFTLSLKLLKILRRGPSISETGRTVGRLASKGSGTTAGRKGRFTLLLHLLCSQLRRYLPSLRSSRTG